MEFKNQDLSHETLIELIKSYQNDLKLMIQEKKCSKCQQLVDQTEGKSLETMSHFQKISDLEFDTNPQIDGLQVPEAFNQTTLTGSEQLKNHQRTRLKYEQQIKQFKIKEIEMQREINEVIEKYHKEKKTNKSILDLNMLIMTNHEKQIELIMHNNETTLKLQEQIKQQKKDAETMKISNDK